MLPHNTGAPSLPLPLPLPLSVCLSLSVWLCGIELLIRIVARPNEFRPSSFCNGAADPKLWALILLSSVWWKNHLTAIQLCHSLTKARKGDRHNGQFYYVFFFPSSFFFFFFSFWWHTYAYESSCSKNVCIRMRDKRNIAHIHIFLSFFMEKKMVLLVWWWFLW